MTHSSIYYVAIMLRGKKRFCHFVLPVVVVFFLMFLFRKKMTIYLGKERKKERKKLPGDKINGHFFRENFVDCPLLLPMVSWLAGFM